MTRRRLRPGELARQGSSGRTVVGHLTDQIVSLVQGSLGMDQRDVTMRARAARAKRSRGLCLCGSDGFGHLRQLNHNGH
jgi:hypothetical protein